MLSASLCLHGSPNVSVINLVTCHTGTCVHDGNRRDNAGWWPRQCWPVSFTCRHDTAVYALVCLLGSAVAATLLLTTPLPLPLLETAAKLHACETLSTGPCQGPTSNQMMMCGCAARIFVVLERGAVPVRPLACAPRG